MKQLSDEEYIEFFEKVKEKLDGVKAIAKEYGLEDVFAMSYIGGVYKHTDMGDYKFMAQCDFVVTDEEELDEILAASLDIYRLSDEALTADQALAMPEELQQMGDWTDEDWLNFINKNTKDDELN